jgi:hypothetical protein
VYSAGLGWSQLRMLQVVRKAKLMFRQLGQTQSSSRRLPERRSCEKTSESCEIAGYGVRVGTCEGERGEGATNRRCARASRRTGCGYPSTNAGKGM